MGGVFLVLHLIIKFIISPGRYGEYLQESGSCQLHRPTELHVTGHGGGQPALVHQHTGVMSQSGQDLQDATFNYHHQIHWLIVEVQSEDCS